MKAIQNSPVGSSVLLSVLWCRFNWFVAEKCSTLQGMWNIASTAHWFKPHRVKLQQSRGFWSSHPSISIWSIFLFFKGSHFHGSKFLCKSWNAKEYQNCITVAEILMHCVLDCTSLRHMTWFWSRLWGIMWTKSLFKNREKKWSYLKFECNSWKKHHPHLY